MNMTGHDIDHYAFSLYHALVFLFMTGFLLWLLITFVRALFTIIAMGDRIKNIEATLNSIEKRNAV